MFRSGRGNKLSTLGIAYTFLTLLNYIDWYGAGRETSHLLSICVVGLKCHIVHEATE